MSPQEVLQHVQKYMDNEVSRIDYGDLSFSVAVHKGDLRKLTFSTTVKSIPTNPNRGPQNDNHNSR